MSKAYNAFRLSFSGGIDYLDNDENPGWDSLIVYIRLVVSKRINL